MRRRSLPFILSPAYGSLLEVIESWILKMVEQQIHQAHGHSIQELEQLLVDACDLFESEVSLESHMLGGWSNLNIPGHSGGIDFVLKLPCTLASPGTGPYRCLYDVSLFFNKLGIAARPLAIGQLPDAKDTPYIVFEYVDGVIHDSLSDFTHAEIESLRECLHILSNQVPPGIPRFESPSDYLVSSHSLIENHEQVSRASNELARLIDSVNEIYPIVLSYTDSLGEWTPSVMHGDLWVPNIVFHSGGVTLLDFEACAVGSSFYDLAYLFETTVHTPEDINSFFLSSDDEHEVSSLLPIVLSYLIEWSLERLLSMEAGVVESNLDTPRIRTSIFDYSRSKMSKLRSILF